LSDADLVAVAGGVILTAGAVALQLVVGRDVFRSRGAASRWTQPWCGASPSSASYRATSPLLRREFAQSTAGHTPERRLTERIVLSEDEPSRHRAIGRRDR